MNPTHPRGGISLPQGYPEMYNPLIFAERMSNDGLLENDFALHTFQGEYSKYHRTTLHPTPYTLIHPKNQNCMA